MIIYDIVFGFIIKMIPKDVNKTYRNWSIATVSTCWRVHETGTIYKLFYYE